MRILFLAALFLTLLACPALAKEKRFSRSKAVWSEVKVVVPSTSVNLSEAKLKGYGPGVSLRRNGSQDKDPSPARPRLRFPTLQ